jgi:hypothetical protein
MEEGRPWTCRSCSATDRLPEQSGYRPRPRGNQCCEDEESQRPGELLQIQRLPGGGHCSSLLVRTFRVELNVVFSLCIEGVKLRCRSSGDVQIAHGHGPDTLQEQLHEAQVHPCFKTLYRQVLGDYSGGLHTLSLIAEHDWTNLVWAAEG